MTAKTVKTPNYLPEQVEFMRAAYEAAPTKETVEMLAAKLGKNARSIVAKLSREGVYHKAEYVSKTGEKPIKKDEHADAIGKMLGLNEAEADSLTKANKTALAKIAAALASSRPIDGDE